MGSDFKFSKGDIETIILNALHNDDKYGYEIAKEIKEKTDNKYEIKQPTLYGYLKRLEDQNLIAFYWGEESHGGRRKYFRLTSYGKSICEQHDSNSNFEKSNFGPHSLDFSNNSLDSDSATQENDFSIKKSRRRKVRKDFKDENENQELFTKLMQLSQTAEDIDTENYPISVDDCEENYTKTEIFFNNETLEKAESSFIDEQTIEEQFDFTAESDVGLENDSYSKLVTNKTPCESNIVEQEEFEQEESKIDTFPVLERKKNQSSQTEIYNEFTFVEIENTQKEALPRLENCDEKFVPKTESINIDPEVEEIKQQKAEYLNSLLSVPAYEEIKPSSLQLTPEENETESQYKQILSSLLGDQIVNTDDKIAQITPKLSSHRNEFTSENLTMAEMADSLAKEGYRIRFYNSTTSQYKAVPMLAKNKINCVTAWSTLIVFYALLGISWLICGSGVNIFAVCMTAFAFLLIPSYYTYVYITRPDVRIKSEHNFKHSIGSKMLIFIFATAFLFTLNLLLFKTNLADPADMMHKFIIPELLIFSLIISEIIYNAFLKHKSFYN